MLTLVGVSQAVLEKNPPTNAGNAEDNSFNPWVSKITCRKWQPLQYFRLENSMDRGAWHAAVHGT